MHNSMYVRMGQRGCHYTKGAIDYVDIRVNPDNPQAMRHVFWLLDHGCIDYSGTAACLAFRKLVDAASPDTYHGVRFRIMDWRNVPTNAVGWFGRVIGRAILRHYARWCVKNPDKSRRGEMGVVHIQPSRFFTVLERKHLYRTGSA